jgi:molybdopterin/thiamine biosynthesis adenylyltransferase
MAARSRPRASSRTCWSTKRPTATALNPLRVRESDLQHHLGVEGGKALPRRQATTSWKKSSASLAAMKNRKPLEFGSKDDFQLAQAINHFKGLPVKLAKSRRRWKCRARRRPPRRAGRAGRGAARAEGEGPEAVTDDELLRYSRHILLDEIGIEGQQRLLGASALVIGAGGLGSPAAMYLASPPASGASCWSTTTTVDLTNLQRQIMHATCRIGQPKVVSGRESLPQINPGIEVVALRERADGERLAELVRTASVVLDCSDNFATRHAVNRACVAARVPLVSGAVIRFDGQVSVFDPRSPDSPCYACLFPAGRRLRGRRLQQHGRVRPAGRRDRRHAGPKPKLLLGIGPSLAGRLLLLDGRAMEWTSIGIGNPACPTCAHR